MTHFRMGSCPAGQALERTLAQREATRADGTEALDEVLVGVGGVELHELDGLGSGVEPSERPRDVRLAGARRAVEDELPLIHEKAIEAMQVHWIEKELLGEFFERARGRALGVGLRSWLTLRGRRGRGVPAQIAPR